MQFESRVNIIALCIIFLMLVTRGHSMKCIECKDENCAGEGITTECTTEIVLHTHEPFAGLNPSLESSAPVDAEYACFQLYSSIIVDNEMFLPVVEFGCTFRQTPFCVGWDDDVMIHKCRVCHTDGCNANSGNTTEPPGLSTTTEVSGPSSTTTTANPNDTAGADGKICTGSWLVIAGLCLMIFF